jgi:hypothetical protein
MGFGSTLFGLAPVFGLAAAARLLVGLGASVILIAFLRLAAEWFRPNEFATISGFSQTAGSLGAIAATTPLALLVEGIGWRSSFAMTGGITLLLGVTAALFVSDRPENMGLAPVNTAGPGPALSFRKLLAGILSIVANPQTWPPALAAAGMYGTYVAFVGLWGVPYLTQVYGIPRVEASNLMALAAVGTMVRGPLIGWMSARAIARRRPALDRRRRQGIGDLDPRHLGVDRIALLRALGDVEGGAARHDQVARGRVGTLRHPAQRHRAGNVPDRGRFQAPAGVFALGNISEDSCPERRFRGEEAIGAALHRHTGLGDCLGTTGRKL